MYSEESKEYEESGKETGLSEKVEEICELALGKSQRKERTRDRRKQILVKGEQKVRKRIKEKLSQIL